MKAAIVFHSICGNTYLMAKMFEEALKSRGCEVSLLKVKDDGLKDLSEQIVSAKDFLEDILALPEVRVDDLFDKDIVVMGSPTYYGNVSAEMKKFMDTTSSIWIEAKYAGKKLGAFTSAGNSEGGGDHCLQAIYRYGQHQGMVSISIPPNICVSVGCGAYGIMHYSGIGDQRPDSKIRAMIEAYTKILIDSV